MEPEPVKYEDERRWLLLDGMPDTNNTDIGHIDSVDRITQFYIPVTMGSLRYRRSINVRTGKETYTEAHKAPKEFSRGAECEVEIHYWVYEARMYDAIGNTIKTRTTLTIDDWVFELDEFLGECSGLVIVELEFKCDKSVDEEVAKQLYQQYLALQLPDCFGRNIEITGDSAYSNLQLATQGMPESFYEYCSS